MKKFLKTLTIIALLTFQTSCITKALWKGTPKDEEILQSFVGNDGRYIVLISDSYHYVFTDNTGILRTILSLKQRNILKPSDKSFFEVDKNNDVEGVLFLEGPFDLLPREDMLTLATIGITPNKNNKVIIEVKVVGRRYAARYLGSRYSIKPIFTVPVYHTSSNIAKDVGKAAITPVTVSLDAVVIIGKVVLYPFSYFGG